MVFSPSYFIYHPVSGLSMMLIKGLHSTLMLAAEITFQQFSMGRPWDIMKPNRSNCGLATRCVRLHRSLLQEGNEKPGLLSHVKPETGRIQDMAASLAVLNRLSLTLPMPGASLGKHDHRKLPKPLPAPEDSPDFLPSEDRQKKLTLFQKYPFQLLSRRFPLRKTQCLS